MSVINESVVISQGNVLQLPQKAPSDFIALALDFSPALRPGDFIKSSMAYGVGDGSLGVAWPRAKGSAVHVIVGGGDPGGENLFDVVATTASGSVITQQVSAQIIETSGPSNSDLDGTTTNGGLVMAGSAPLGSGFISNGGLVACLGAVVVGSGYVNNNGIIMETGL